MNTDINLDNIHTEIQTMKKSAAEIKRLGEAFPAASRNASRILASVKMLELNISDLVELSEDRA